MTPLTVCIGYDSREPVALAVLAHSILTRASQPISLLPLTRKAVAHLYTRPMSGTESTEFSMTRFLTPHLCGPSGYSIFMDCDMLCQTDIWDVMAHVLADPGKAVYVSPHDYIPRTSTKFLGQTQTTYPRKNWSSVMVFDNAQCQHLTPEYVNHASGAELHRFSWLRDDQIGYLPLDWNWLVGEYLPNPEARVLHYTLGGPWFPECQDVDHADLWRKEFDQMQGSYVRDLEVA